MRRRNVLRIAFPASISLVAACSLTTDLTGLTGGGGTDASARDASAIDATASDGTASDAQSSADATVVDSSVEPIDAGGAQVDSGAGDAVALVDAGTWCHQQIPTPVLCVDFDEGDPIGFGWNSIRETTGHSSVTIDPLAFSPPSSARSALANAPTCTYADFLYTAPGTPAEFHLEFEIRLGDVDGGGNTPYFDAHFAHSGAGGAGGCYEIWQVTDTGASLQLNGEASSVHANITRYPVRGKWSKINVDIVPQGSTASMSMLVDDVVAMPPTTLTNCKVGGEADFSLGQFCGSGTAELRLDNVKFTSTPK